ncbi:MAG TPA: crossover junction endodeoxyribonuclease RuvC [Firmicutes bacterium]|nr:crossover junction endodeoxyribonuclease RuvC [Bacillota bacterium]
MIVLGIDPGIALTGYGIVEGKGHGLSAVAYGCIRTKPGITHSRRLMEIFRSVSDLIIRYKPDAVAIEELFFNKNARTALKVGESRGVVILAAITQGVKLVEYTPLEVKQAIAGYGRATKGQVQGMVKMLLHLDEIPSPDDTADALACAICHINSEGPLRYLVQGPEVVTPGHRMVPAGRGEIVR